MQRGDFKFLRGSVFTKRIALLLFSGLFFLNGCHSVKTLTESERKAGPAASYSVLIYIHGDGDYLFHEDGRAVRADLRAVEKAQKVAENAVSGEVMIFHHRPQRKVLGLFPRNTNRAYHYRGGELKNELAYRIAAADTPFMKIESELFKEFRSTTESDGHRLFFLYFGHEIPEFPGHPYHRSVPGTDVSTHSFIEGIDGFLKESESFDLVALSTCSNGTPSMATGLSSVTDILLASPQDLHLSHLDIEHLDLLEMEPEIPSAGLATALAEATFERLSQSIQTAVTLSVYDLERAGEYLSDFNKEYHHYLKSGELNMAKENKDCGELPFFDEMRYSDGVFKWFRPAIFGKNLKAEGSSGWGCKPG